MNNDIYSSEECAMAKVKEEGLESKLERIDKITTTYFDVETRVWGNETSGTCVLMIKK
jgi:hypothetical protein